MRNIFQYPVVINGQIFLHVLALRNVHLWDLIALPCDAAALYPHLFISFPQMYKQNIFLLCLN